MVSSHAKKRRTPYQVPGHRPEDAPTSAPPSTTPAPIWTAIRPLPYRGAYRVVTVEFARQITAAGIPKERIDEIRPKEWFDKWFAANLAIDTVGAAATPPHIRGPNGPFFEAAEFWAKGKALYEPKNIRAASPALALHAATVGGATALGRNDLGRIAIGARADLVLVDLAHPLMQPARDPLRSLIYHAADRAVRIVLIDGEVACRDGRVAGLDLASAAAQLVESQARMLRDAST